MHFSVSAVIVQRINKSEFQDTKMWTENRLYKFALYFSMYFLLPLLLHLLKVQSQCANMVLDSLVTSVTILVLT